MHTVQVSEAAHAHLSNKPAACSLGGLASASKSTCSIGNAAAKSAALGEWLPISQPSVGTPALHGAVGNPLETAGKPARVWAGCQPAAKLRAACVLAAAHLRRSRFHLSTSENERSCHVSHGL